MAIGQGSGLRSALVSDRLEDLLEAGGWLSLALGLELGSRFGLVLGLAQAQ